LAEGAERDYYRVHRAYVLFQTGQTAQAIAEADSLTQGNNVPGDTLYRAACTHALAAAALDHNSQQAESHAVEAVALAGSGLDWFWETYAKEATNRKRPCWKLRWCPWIVARGRFSKEFGVPTCTKPQENRRWQYSRDTTETSVSGLLLFPFLQHRSEGSCAQPPYLVQVGGCFNRLENRPKSVHILQRLDRWQQL
jgi:hypothetical protein